VTSVHRFHSHALPFHRLNRVFFQTVLFFGAHAPAQPVLSPWPIEGENDAPAVAASDLGGYCAAGNSSSDRVELRDIRGVLLRAITRAEILALLPWMNLDAGPDGPSALALTGSGRSLFVLVHDDTFAPDGQGSDAVLRYDLATNTLGVFARLDLYDRGDQWAHLAAVHHRAILYVGTAAGQIRAYLANAAAPTGTLLATWTLPATGPIRGLCVDRDSHTLFAATDTAVYRTVLTNSFGSSPTWNLVIGAEGIRDLTWGDVYGSPGNRGLYLLRADSTGSRIDFVPAIVALGGVANAPLPYLSTPMAIWHSLAASGDGRMILGREDGTAVVADASDPRLSFDSFLADEFAQVVNFARGLISPDGEPPGWVIDADTIPSIARFHPATPDAAAWAVLLLLASDVLNNDPEAIADIREILTRYSGLSADGIAPSRSTDGIFRHWLDPWTGGVKPGWDGEFAVMSTMKIVAAASRAMDHYPDDPTIARAASHIIFRTRNWDSYIQPGTMALYLRGLSSGGPDTSVPLRPFNEGIIFVAEGSRYAGEPSNATYGAWLNRGLWPTASYVPAHPITVISPGVHEAAFVSIYPALLLPEYRASPAWRTQVANVRWSSGAWTDDFGPRYMTVFSAGTTRGDWGGYHADTLGSHPGDVTTLTALMGLSAFGDIGPAAQAYHAYRKGARQTFRSGAGILYRRSDVDRTYEPNSAGLPDVAMGALAVGELLLPGLIDSILSRPFTPREMCPVDVDADAAIGVDDLYAATLQPLDLNGDGIADRADRCCLVNWVRRHEVRYLVSQ
jgi:hypothetical protein